MSRIGNKPIPLPQGVSATLKDTLLTVKGSKGTLEFNTNEEMEINISESEIVIERPSDSKQHKMIHGTTRSVIVNMVEGVSNGFSKRLKLVGVGYRAQMQGKKLVLNVGYSNPVELDVPNGLTVEVPKNTVIAISGFDKQQVGQFAAVVREVRPPEPYLGKGIRYEKEHVRRKEGKTATTTAG